MPRSQSPVVLPGDPTAALHATTKQYVDAGLVLKLNSTDLLTEPGPSPASILNIGVKPGQGHFSAQLARLGDAAFFTKSTRDIANGYEESPIFYGDTSKRYVIMYVQVGAPTTGGSSYARAEWREQNESGGDMQFDATDANTHTAQGTFRIHHAPAVLPDIVCAQLHNGTADRISIRTQLVSGTWRLRIRFNGSTVTLDAGGTDIATGIANIQDYDWVWKIQTVNGLPTVWVGLATDANALVTAKYTGATAFTSTGSATWYHKSGCYLQTTTASDTSTDYGEVWIKSLTSWHTGWATPAPFYGAAKHAPAHAVGGYDDLSANYVPWVNVAAANGVASLDASGDVPLGQVPDLSATYIATSRLDVSNGIPVLTGSVLPRKYNQYANTTQDGTIVLTGDLGGTATAPTVPGLAGKAATVHAHAGTDITSGTIAVGRLPTNVANGVPQLDGTGIIPTALQYGASTSTYGIIQLAGDLAGTAALPKLVANVIRAFSGTATTLTDADGIVVCTPTTGTCVATVPTPVGRSGKRFIIKKAYGATPYAVQITPAAGTVDGQASETIMVAGGYREIVSDGSNYHIVGGTVIPVIYSPTAPGVGGTANPDATMGSVFRYAPAVANWTLGNPTNGVDGLQINIEIAPTTAFSLSITGPALTTGITSPIAVANGKKCFVGLRYSGSTWYVLAATVQS